MSKVRQIVSCVTTVGGADIMENNMTNEAMEPHVHEMHFLSNFLCSNKQWLFFNSV